MKNSRFQQLKQRKAENFHVETNFHAENLLKQHKRAEHFLSHFSFPLACSMDLQSSHELENLLSRINMSITPSNQTQNSDSLGQTH